MAWIKNLMALQKIYKLRHFPKPLPSKVYLDANFLFHCRIASGKFYKVANALLSAFMIKRGCTLNVSTLALDEVWKKTPDVVAGRRVINNKHDWATNMPHFRSLSMSRTPPGHKPAYSRLPLPENIKHY